MQKIVLLLFIQCVLILKVLALDENYYMCMNENDKSLNQILIKNNSWNAIYKNNEWLDSVFKKFYENDKKTHSYEGYPTFTLDIKHKNAKKILVFNFKLIDNGKILMQEELKFGELYEDILTLFVPLRSEKNWTYQQKSKHFICKQQNTEFNINEADNLFKNQNLPVHKLALSANNKFLFLATMKEIFIYDIYKNKIISKISNFNNNEPFEQLVASPNDKYLFSFKSGSNSKIKIHNLDTNNLVNEAFWYDVGSLIITSQFTPDNKYLAIGGSDLRDNPPNGNYGYINILDTLSLKVIKSYSFHKDGINSLSISNDGTKVISAGFGSKIYVLDIYTGKVINSFDNNSNIDIEYISYFNNDEKIVVVYRNGLINILNSENGNVIKEFKTLSDSLSSNTDNFLISCNKTNCEVLNLKTGNKIKTISSNNIDGVISNQTNELFVINNFNQLEVYDLITGKNRTLDLNFNIE